MPRGTEDVASSVHAGFLGVSPDAIPVTLDDATNDPNGPFRALRADGAGDVKVTTWRGTERVLKFGAGETRDVGVLRVWSTGTTATDIEGMP